MLTAYLCTTSAFHSYVINDIENNMHFAIVDILSIFINSYYRSLPLSLFFYYFLTHVIIKKPILCKTLVQCGTNTRIQKLTKHAYIFYEKATAHFDVINPTEVVISSHAAALRLKKDLNASSPWRHRFSILSFALDLVF